MSSKRSPPAPPAIADYGLVGNLRSAALVSSEGSVDWWCPSRFDGPSVFAALLDPDAGGGFSVSPAEAARIESRCYEVGTNVLATRWRGGDGGLAEVLDFMPVWGDLETGGDHPLTSALLRRVTVEAGEMTFEVRFDPRFAYASSPARLERENGLLRAAGGGEALALRWFAPEEPAVRVGRRGARFLLRLSRGEVAWLLLDHRGFVSADPPPACGNPEDLLERTREAWRSWDAATRIGGPYATEVRRCALALKLLEYGPTGALVAAPTTSLPERIGGVRNWDYRFAWIRDAALSVRALHELGHTAGAERFADWLLKHAGEDPGDLRILYGITGERDLPERTVGHLSGYRGSRPVRVGNAAAAQRQLDVYGELLDCVEACRAYGPDLEGPRWRYFRRVADWVAEHWREPDHGIWEVRTAPRHFVSSKALAWAALDRAARAARALGHPHSADRWAAEAVLVREEALRRGYDPVLGAFRQAYETPHLDASNLLLPLVGFLNARDPRIVATVDATMRRLLCGGLLYRYDGAEDGLPDGEGAFTLCTCWLVEVLAMQGRMKEAHGFLEALLARASPLGLFGEEIDPASGEHLGNFPQGFPLLGIIRAAVTLERCEAEGAPRPEEFSLVG